MNFRDLLTEGALNKDQVWTKIEHVTDKFKKEIIKTKTIKDGKEYISKDEDFGEDLVSALVEWFEKVSEVSSIKRNGWDYIVIVRAQVGTIIVDISSDETNSGSTCTVTVK
jgi:hypothetical protein